MNKNKHLDDLHSPFDDELQNLSKDQKREAYKFACETRKFEIELYWKRAAYFWGFLIVTFGSFGIALKEFGFGHSYTFIISLVGFTFSLVWYFANRGSKYWQMNWEHHIKKLEDEFAGPIYKNPIDTSSFHLHNLWAAYRFSISKLNQLVSLYIATIWFFLIIRVVSKRWQWKEPIVGLNFYIFGFVTVVFIIIILIVCRSRSK